MYTSESINIKSQVINNIMLQMSMYIDKAAVDILQKVLEEQFVFLNVEQITTLPAEINRSTEEKNRYLAGLYQVKKRNLSRETMEQYLRSIRSLAAVIDKPYTDMDEIEREGPDPRAVERFRRQPYQAARMIRDQGRKLEHKSVAQYIADKFGIDGEDDNRGQENT